jgi:hypothetical protein
LNQEENAMRNLGRSVLALWVIVMGLAVSAPALADSVGPYYATPSWDQTLPATTRFIVLSNFASVAVLDRETGLVWERGPGPISLNWVDASSHCVGLSLGGRKGWRLPTVQDLASLIDPTQLNPALPPGHPFFVLFAHYWSATDARDPQIAWSVDFGNGNMDMTPKVNPINFAWCVRGGPGVDLQ